MQAIKRCSIALFSFVIFVVVADAESLPQRNYYLYVCAESDDVVEKIRFGPAGFEVIKSISVGAFPAETEGPHGISMSPDGRHWFLSIAHGMPFGSIHKFDTEEDEWLADVTVGMFPATMSISSATGLLYVVNFNLHGDAVPSSISIVETSTMIEVARVDVGIMPHGARINDNGKKLYSVNMMGDSLVEVDTFNFEVSRTLSLLKDDSQEGLLERMSHTVKPTWATSPTAKGKLYVAGNGDHNIYEIDVNSWKVVRTLVVGSNMGPYNLDVTSDGTILIATYKSGQHVGIWDLEKAKELARIKTTRRVPHGVVVSDDDKYAFVTLEGVGGEPGTVEVYDLALRSRVAEVDVGKQAGGIAFWKGEP